MKLASLRFPALLLLCHVVDDAAALVERTGLNLMLTLTLTAGLQPVCEVCLL